MGVFGEESCAEAGEESVSILVGRRRDVGCDCLLPATDVTLESSSSSYLSVLEALELDVRRGGVPVFDGLDFEDVDDRSSFSFLDDFRCSELRELGLEDISEPSSLTLLIREDVDFCRCVNSVSGGLGGLPFAEAARLRFSADLDLFFSESISVASGV